MSVTPPPEIDSLPQYPTRGQKREEFTPLANNFVAAQQAFVNQVNAGLTWAHGTFTALADAESNASQSAQTATTKAGIATTKAGEAAGSALAAARSEEQARYFAEQVVEELGLPVLEDNLGKVLTVIEQAGVKKIGWQEALPPVGAGDAGLALLAKPGGGGVWGETGVPADQQYVEITESGHFEKHPKARFLYVECIKAGDGGYSGELAFKDVGAYGASAPIAEAAQAAPVVDRGVMLASNLPASIPVVIGAPGIGGLGARQQYSYTKGGTTVSDYTNGVAPTPGGDSWFLSQDFLSTSSVRLRRVIGDATQSLIGYPSSPPKGVYTKARQSADPSHNEVPENGGDGSVDDTGKVPAAGGTSVGSFSTSISISREAGAGSSTTQRFCSGGGGGCCTAAPNTETLANDITRTLKAGNAGNSGTGSPGATGGSVCFAFDKNRMNHSPITVSVDMSAGNGGKGGPGLIRIWQW